MKKYLKVFDKIGVIAEKLQVIVYLRNLLSEDIFDKTERDIFILKDKELANNFLLECERDLYIELSDALTFRECE